MNNQCKCRTWCWDFGEITENGKYEVPEHHPKCENFTELTLSDKSLEDLEDECTCPHGFLCGCPVC